MVFTPDGEYPVINAEKGMIRVYFSTEYSGESVHGGSVINAVPESCTAVPANIGADRLMLQLRKRVKTQLRNILRKIKIPTLC